MIGFRRFTRALGITLVLGGLAHTMGVSRLFLTQGLPGANRILLDAWVAEAQLVAGLLFLIGRGSSQPRPWMWGGATVVWMYALPFLPVLVHRASLIFWVMPIAYSIASAVAVRWASAGPRPSEKRP